MQNDRIKGFQINVAQEVLSDLEERLKKTRWSYQIDGTGWDAGTDVDYLKDLLEYWQNGYDWRKHEQSLNQFAYFKPKWTISASTSSMSAAKGPIRSRSY